MEIRKLETPIASLLAAEGLHLYSLQQRREGGDRILEVVIDESLDLDHVSAVSAKISDLLDELDTGKDPFTLDVSCVGAERPFRNTEELLQAVGSYVCITTKEGEVTGDLLAANAEELLLSVKVKNIRRQQTVRVADVQKARLAVRF